MGMIETAFAKINLALHVRQRRADGYHQLETLFAFVDDGDILSVELADEDRLTISGEFAEGLSTGPDNLVIQALERMRAMVSPGQPSIPPLAIHLEKRLPVAAGIGGGSADAAAMIRLLDRHFVHNGDKRELVLATAALGADVGACIVSETRLGIGKGNDLHMPGTDDARGLPVLLVNPGLPLATGPVFKAWDGIDRGPLNEGSVLSVARAGRNDLEPPALGLCPEIDEVLTLLRAQLPLMARMSGSGATCFALFRSMDAMQSAAIRIADDHPDWWVMGGQLR
jgi:4-diphosphocytidyl-2-C-methyl-D-erythritol kinase